MSYQRTIYGVEYDARRRPPKTEGRAVLTIVAMVAVAASVSLSYSIYRRVRAADADGKTPAVSSETRNDSAAPASRLPVSAALARVLTPEGYSKRPAKVRNLLLRMEEAVSTGDIELEAATIEQLRTLDGSPAVDLDDMLARRLGDLNVHRLFEMRSLKWVTEVTVRPGASASRIAYEHGSTLASLRKLNGDIDISKIRSGEKLWVMDHPRLKLTVGIRRGIADLSLNGKFFRRYDVAVTADPAQGSFAVADRAKRILKEKGIGFKVEDMFEIDMLMPKDAVIVISEY